MAKSKRDIRPGDQYIRLGSTRTLWEVVELLELKDLPPHLQLRSIDGGRLLTFSEAALLDKRFFEKAGESAQERVMAETAKSESKRVKSLFGRRPTTPAVSGAH